MIDFKPGYDYLCIAWIGNMAVLFGVEVGAPVPRRSSLVLKVVFACLRVSLSLLSGMIVHVF
jgi:hypothetical protein